MPDHKPVKALVPLSWRLFQTIQRSPQLTNMIFFTFNNEPLWLMHVYGFFKLTM